MASAESMSGGVEMSQALSSFVAQVGAETGNEFRIVEESFDVVPDNLLMGYQVFVNGQRADAISVDPNDFFLKLSSNGVGLVHELNGAAQERIRSQLNERLAAVSKA
jgi:hypothetical protein